MRAGWNPTRRNRNQGTAKRGLGQDNRMVVPCTSRSGRPFYEQLRDPVTITRGTPTPLRFYVEKPRHDSLHACTVDDILRVLRALPADDVRSLVAIVLRQPTRKQALLRPVWGRMLYARYEGARKGPAIFLDAQPSNLHWLAPVSSRPEDEIELERLREDGHRLTRERRAWRIESPPAAVRATQLYRTLPHEVGHHVDHRDFMQGSTDEQRERQFVARPRAEREAAAHRYADEWAKRLRANGTVAVSALPASGDCDLDPAWFFQASLDLERWH